MAIANCGGLQVDGTSLTVVGNIVTPIATTEPTGFVIGNCGGVKFCSDDFQILNNTITNKSAEIENIKPITVIQSGCGGLQVDSTYFSIDDNGLLKYAPPTNDNDDKDEETDADVEEME